MPRKRTRGRAGRKPVREWIVEALRGSRPLTSAKLGRKVAGLSGSRFHPNSIYLALRSLLARGGISVTRKGRQRFYELTPGAAPGAARAPSSAVVPRATTVAPSTTPAAGPLQHRLAFGEIAILRVEGGTVVSATNVHGELVLKKHRIPSL